MKTVKTVLVGLAMVATLALSATPARAAAFIDFSTGSTGAGGVYTLLAGGHASGTNIPVGVLTVGPAGQVTGCLPTCVYDTAGTGPGNQLFPDPNGSAVLNFNTQTNFIQVVGYIPGLGINSSVVLLSGTFLGWTADANGLTNAIGPDVKHPALLAALGIPTNTPFAFFGFSLTTGPSNAINCVDVDPDPNVVVCGAGSTFAVTSTDIRNDAVPEPGSMVLLGTGLLGLAAAARRRMRKNKV